MQKSKAATRWNSISPPWWYWLSPNKDANNLLSQPFEHHVFQHVFLEMLHYKIILLLLSSSVLIHSADNTSTTKSRGRSFFLHANEQESNFSTRKQQSNVWTTLLPTYFFSLLPKEALIGCILYWFNQHFSLHL